MFRENNFNIFARAALTGLKKKGNVVTSEKLEGQDRVYRAAEV